LIDFIVSVGVSGGVLLLLSNWANGVLLLVYQPESSGSSTRATDADKLFDGILFFAMFGFVCLLALSIPAIGVYLLMSDMQPFTGAAILALTLAACGRSILFWRHLA
jgi:hypothetical protein